MRGVPGKKIREFVVLWMDILFCQLKALKSAFIDKKLRAGLVWPKYKRWIILFKKNISQLLVSHQFCGFLVRLDERNQKSSTKLWSKYYKSSQKTRIIQNIYTFWLILLFIHFLKFGSYFLFFRFHSSRDEQIVHN